MYYAMAYVFCRSILISGDFSIFAVTIEKIKGTSSIPSVKSTPSHMKENSFTCSLVIN